MSRTKVEWADYQWNPLTGFQKGRNPGGIDFKRFSGDVRWNLKNLKYRKDGDIYILDEKPVGPSGSTLMYPFGSAPTYHRYKERFDALVNMQSPRNILVCQDSDLFGPWVPDWIIKEVMDFLQIFEDYHFLFVTDYPERLNGLANNGTIVVQENFWYGIRVTKGTVKSPFAGCYGHWFTVIEPEKQIRFEDYPNWTIFNKESQFNADIYTSLPIMTPTFDTGTKDVREIPKYLKFSEKEKKKIYGTCMNCGKVHFKSEMYTLTARLRKEPSFTYGYMCHDCMSRERPINE